MLIPLRLSKEPDTIAFEESGDGVIVASNNERYLGLRAQYPIFFLRFSANLNFFQQILIKAPNTKFHGNPSKVAALIHEDRWTDMPKLICFLRDYANKVQKPVRLFSGSYDILNEELQNASL
jgi:hypothetical protein